MLKAIIVGFVLSCATAASGYKIIMFPYGNRSHLIQFHGLGQVLLDRGHEVHIYLSKVDTPPAEIAKAGYKFINPNLDETLMPLWFKEEDVIKRIDMPYYEQLIVTRKESLEFIAHLNDLARTQLNDVETLEAIRKEKFDFALVDSVSFLAYTFIIPLKLDIPYGGLTTLHDPFSNRVPHFPSAFPDSFFSTAFGVHTDQLGTSFSTRLKNFLAVFFHEYWMQGWTDEVFRENNATFEKVNENLALNIIDQHYMLTDPTPTIPNVLMVGGLATRPPRPIKDAKLLHFIQDTPHPVIVCSFGTMMQSLTPDIVSKLFDAFQLLPQYRFVMRLKNAGANAVTPPDNLLILDWLPQNDLLAHNKTALLITHSGNNGQNEALYHGMPMVAFYVFGDQQHNAERVERREYGVKLNLLSFNHTELVQAIERVMTDDKYRRNIKKASEIFREQRPGDIAADAIEHVIKFGSDHLRPTEAFTLSLVEFLLFDIVFYFFTLALVVLYLSYRVLVVFCKRCCKTN